MIQQTMKTTKFSLFSKAFMILLGIALALPSTGKAEVSPAEAKKLFDNCKVEAERGKPAAQFAIGSGYLLGVGVEVDQPQGVIWLRKAADQEHASAPHLLGSCFFNGWGYDKNQTEAVKWFKKAADQGQAPAQSILGICYVNGWGCEKDQTEAVKWFKKAADQGDPRAQFELGYCYYAGRGVEMDKALAAPLLRKASEQGIAEAHFLIGACYRFGRGVPKDLVEAYAYYTLSDLASDDPRKTLLNLLKEKMTPEEIIKGEQRAKELKGQIQARLNATPSGK